MKPVLVLLKNARRFGYAALIIARCISTVRRMKKFDCVEGEVGVEEVGGSVYEADDHYGNHTIRSVSY